MKRVVTLTAFLLFAAGATFGQQSPASRAADLLEIERLESEWNTINEVSDAEGKARLLAEDSYHVGPSGRLYNKRQDIEAMRLSRQQKEAANRTTRFVISDRRIRLYKDVAIVTLTGTSISNDGGEERRGRSFRAVHVWEKRNGAWQVTIDQVTTIAN